VHGVHQPGQVVAGISQAHLAFWRHLGGADWLVHGLGELVECVARCSAKKPQFWRLNREFPARHTHTQVACRAWFAACAKLAAIKSCP